MFELDTNTITNSSHMKKFMKGMFIERIILVQNESIFFQNFMNIIKISNNKYETIYQYMKFDKTD